MGSKSFRDLIVWQKAIDLVDIIYTLSKLLPASERFGLISQMQRAAVSMPSNIAEGQKRNNTGEFVHFLGIANASSGELETQLIIVKRQYPEIDCSKALTLNEEVQRMLYVLINKIKTSAN